jgi:hypothetical protein
MKFVPTSSFENKNNNVKNTNDVFDIESFLKTKKLEENDELFFKTLTIENFEVVEAIPGWAAQRLKSARFAHSNKYIVYLSIVYDFDILAHKKVLLRTEETIALHGNLFILRKKNLKFL